MPFTGNIPRTLGQMLLALGAIAVALGLLGLVLSAMLVKEAADNPEFRGGDAGDLFEGLVVGGIGFLAGGTVAVLVGIALIGLGRGLRERLQRQATPGKAAAAPATAPSSN